MTSEIYLHTFTQIHKLLFISLPSKNSLLTAYMYSHEVILMLDFMILKFIFLKHFKYLKIVSNI